MYTLNCIMLPLFARKLFPLLYRFWKFENSIDPASPPALKCVKVFQMPEEHSESQILTCASCSTNQLLAIGLFNGSLHLANLSDLCSALYN